MFFNIWTLRLFSASALTQTRAYFSQHNIEICLSSWSWRELESCPRPLLWGETWWFPGVEHWNDLSPKLDHFDGWKFELSQTGTRRTITHSFSPRLSNFASHYKTSVCSSSVFTYSGLFLSFKRSTLEFIGQIPMHCIFRDWYTFRLQSFRQAANGLMTLIERFGDHYFRNFRELFRRSGAFTMSKTFAVFVLCPPSSNRWNIIPQFLCYFSLRRSSL